MEIQKTSKQGKSKVTNSINIFYNVLEANNTIREIHGNIQKDGDHIGTVTSYEGGRMVLYLDDANGLTSEEKMAVFSKAIEDADSVFNRDDQL